MSDLRCQGREWPKGVVDKPASQAPKTDEKQSTVLSVLYGPWVTHQPPRGHNCACNILLKVANLAKPILLLFLLGIYASKAFPQAEQAIKAELTKATKLRESGAFSDARKIYESLVLSLRAKGPNPELGETLIGLSLIANAEGHYEPAVSLAHEGAEVFQKLGDTAGEGRARNDAGYAYMNAGRYPDAARELDAALGLSSKTKDSKTLVSTLNNLGTVYYYQAKYSETFRAYNAAMQQLEKSADEPWIAHWRQVSLLNLATLYQRLGNNQRALSIYLELKQSPEMKQRTLGHLEANLGVLYRRMGDPEKALEAYKDAEQAYKLQRDVDGELGVTKNIGIVLALELGRLDDALRTFTGALALAEKAGNRREAMQAWLYRGETLYRMHRLREAKSQFETALALASNLGTVEEQWKALYALGRIAESEGQAEIARTEYRDAIGKIESMRSKIQFSQLKSGFLADKRDVYDAMIKLLLMRNDADTAFDYMERSRARVFQDQFYAAKVAPGSVSLNSIRNRLDASTALIEFWVGAEEIAAVWATRDSAGITQHRISATEMERLTRMVANLPESLTEEWRADVRKVTDQLTKDIAPLSAGQYLHILIVPDGFLSVLPLELAPTASGKTLLEDHDLTYLPSAMLLLRAAPADSQRLRFPWQRQLLAFGDPVIVEGTREMLVTSNRLVGVGTLPGSAEEIRKIAAMSTGRTTVFLGSADKKQSFIDATHVKTAMLHLSTHAVADMDNPELSRLLFSPDEPGQPNAYLFLRELYDIDLRGVSLATLSSCDTEQGKLVPGEGIQAFSRALLAAGSRSTLTTLWRVPDATTAEFVKTFYFYLLEEHRPKAEALRLAKLEFLHSGTAWSHPRYWAAFVLNGDGVELIPRFLPWQVLVLPIPVIILVAVLYWHFRQRHPKRNRERETSEALAHH